MRSNKCVLFSIVLLLMSSVFFTTARIYPNPSLGFPERTLSVANALYSAIELPLVTFPFEKVEEETAEMKYRIWMKSRAEVLRDDPKAKFGYKRPSKGNI